MIIKLLITIIIYLVLGYIGCRVIDLHGIIDIALWPVVIPLWLLAEYVKGNAADYSDMDSETEVVHGSKPANILCKAVSSEDGRVVTGNLYLKGRNPYLKPTPDSFLLIPVDSKTVCFCSKKKDKNGNMIWEGDILEDDKGRSFIVRGTFAGNGWYFYLTSHDKNKPSRIKRHRADNMVIVGNEKIHKTEE